MKKKKKPATVLTNSQYNKGFHDGTMHGMRTARKQIAIEFVKSLSELQDIKGIGPITFEKIVSALDVSEPKTLEGNK